MKNSLFTLLFILLLPVIAKAQNEGLKYINRNDLVSYMKFLASDQMKGRETGSPQNDLAALYLETNAMRLGLKPVPGSDGFLQKVAFVSRSVEKGSSNITARDENRNLITSSDSIVSLVPLSVSTEAKGEVVFAGYGYEDKQSGYSDLKDFDITDKIVMIMTRNPEAAADPKFASGYIFDEKIEVSKLMPLFSKRPKAVLVVYDPKNKFHDVYTSGLAEMLGGNNSVSLKGNAGMSIPVRIFFITGYTADKILSKSGMTLKQYQDKIDTEKKPLSGPLTGVNVSFSAKVTEKEFTAYNVVGMVEGSDPVLKNECVVYSAHFDHTGVNEQGEAFNGADDNASGSIGLLGVADAFSHLKKKPLRSVVFVWANAEEKGLLGSMYYVNHPLVSMDKTILDINVDMSGRSITPSDTGKFMGYNLDVTGKDEVIMYNYEKSSELVKLAKDDAAKTGVKILLKGKTMPFGGSDHQSFSMKKVPWIMFHSGIHSDLHSVRDDAEKVDYEKMEKVSKLMFLIGYQVANQKGRITEDTK